MIGMVSRRIVTKFVYPRSCEKWILKSIGRDWRKYKSSLKDAFFKPVIGKNANTKRKALYKLCPEDVDIDQWRGLVKFWKSKKGRALTEKNIISRSLVKNSHNAGTKSFACWSEDMRQADPEKKQPHRSQVRKMRDPTGESFSRQNQHGTRTEHPHARSRKRHTSTIKAGSKVVLKTSTYPNKRNVAYGTICSTDPRTKACGIELGAKFALVRIDQPLLDNEELVREVSDCKTIGETFSSGYLIAWLSAFIREKDN
uniref:Transposase Tnp1/En/Spm-like domain-containing protein n=1 Tax=Hordeum vulgare subsp. vulgare TaxID=112509 RepID=A0A8I6X9Z5_HORVV